MLRTRALIIVTAIFLTSLAIAASRSTASASSQQVDAGPAIGPYLSFAGAFSAIQDSRLLRITDEESFKELWIEHKGDRLEKNAREWEVIPDIDFDQCMVIARFRGDSWNCDGEFVVSMEDRGADVLLRFDSATFQTMGIDGGGIRVTPYGIWVLPRITRPIVIEENTQGLIGHPPVWTEKSRFEALED